MARDELRKAGVGRGLYFVVSASSFSGIIPGPLLLRNLGWNIAESDVMSINGHGRFSFTDCAKVRNSRVHVVDRETSSFFGSQYGLVLRLEFAEVMKFGCPREAGFEGGLRGGPVLERGLHPATREVLYGEDVIGVGLRP
jgi:hypothetical protein